MNLANLKKIGVKNLIMLLIAGILLLFVSVPSFFRKEEQEKEEEQMVTITVSPSPTPQLTQEKRLEEILSNISGVGKVSVMIVYKSTEESVVYLDNNGTVMSIENGTTKPYVTKIKSAEIEGIVIVAQGAERMEVVQDISDATEALFGIGKHKIIVLPMK